MPQYDLRLMKSFTIEELTKEPYKINFLYHITHVDNMQSIHKYGLLSHKRAHTTGYVIEDIADPDVINIRTWKKVPESGKRIVEYVPLFFTPRTPMLFVKKEMQDDIVILCLDNVLLLREDVIFTDGNAASYETNFFNDLQSIDNLDWECIRSSYWSNFEDGTRKRSAEVLVPSHVPFDHIQRIVVRTERTRQKLNSRLQTKVEVDPRWFFDN